MKKYFKLIWNRLLQQSTWSAIIAGITAAAVIPAPWDYVVALIATLKAIAPDSGLTNVVGPTNPTE